MRFAQSLGYEGFKELQALFQRRLSTAAPGFEARIKALEIELGARADILRRMNMLRCHPRAGHASAFRRQKVFRSALRDMVEPLDEEQRRLYEEETAENRSLASHLMEREVETSSGPSLRTTLSVGGVMDYAQCPKRSRTLPAGRRWPGA